MASYQRGAEIDWGHHPVDWSKRLVCTIESAAELDGLKREFESAGYELLWLRVRPPAKLRDLSFLHDIQGIRELDVQGSVQDDTHAFRIQGLRSLALLTRCHRPIPAVDFGGLTELALDNRPGLEHLQDIHRLETLRIFGWPGTSFAFLGTQSNLSTLRVEGRRQVSSLEGLDSCPGLEDVELLDMRVSGLAPLAAAQQLRKLWILGHDTNSEHVTLDLAHLADLQHLAELRITQCGRVRSLRPVATFTSLTDFRIRDTEVLDGDLTPLTQLAAHARVVGPNIDATPAPGPMTGSTE